MKQISTGAGLVALSVGMVATAFIATHRSGGEAFAQGTGGDRRIVNAAVVCGSDGLLVAYRVWSDNAIDLRPLASMGAPYSDSTHSNHYGWAAPVLRNWNPNAGQQFGWQTWDNGTSGFRPITDVDMSGETDAGDISQVLLDFNTRSDDLPPPPIDCTINAPR